MSIITELFDPQRTNANGGERRSGAPGRTRTSTMLPLPDFESGASTNSATGAGGGNIAAKRGGSTGTHLVARAPAKRAPFFRNETQTHARARAGARGNATLSRALCCPPSLIRWCGPGSRVSWSLPSGRASRGPGGSPGTRENAARLHPGTRPFTAFARAE